MTAHLAAQRSLYRGRSPQRQGKVEKRVLLGIQPKVAPVKAAIFPLLKNKPELVEAAKKLYKKLQRRWNVSADASGAIGRRYRRQDEKVHPSVSPTSTRLRKMALFTLRDHILVNNAA